MMEKIDLNGKWETVFFPEGAPAETRTMSSNIPGNLENDLYRNNLINDPYIRLHGMELRPYEFYEWHMTKTFEMDAVDGRYELVLEGIDCFGTIKLNGKEIGTTANALIRHVFETTGNLVEGTNTLEVVINSANNVARKYPLTPDAFSAYPFNYESLRVRKPAHAWGWDITPRFPLGGLFRPVYLRKIPSARFTANYLQTIDGTTATKAKMRLTYNFETEDHSIIGYRLKVTGQCGTSVFQQEQDVWATAGVLRFVIDNPRLWWPRGYGSPNLYQVKYELYKNERLVAEEKATVGIRTVSLHHADTATDGPDTDFVFIVNGQRIMCKGTNWVPADAMHSKDEQRIPAIIELASDLNCNMLRVWGGGIYESELFYDLCDRNGIMIWQDFMMGCAVYPQDEEFLSTIRNEVATIVPQLRQHASIVLWAGDNECDQVPSWGGMNPDPNLNRLTREVIPQQLRILDPLRPYLPSSPYVSPVSYQREKNGGTLPSELSAEQHLWGPRNYFKGDYYRNTLASFVSEMGYHGCPGVGSIKKFISPEHTWPYQNNQEWNFHASNPFIESDSHLNYRTELMASQVKEMFGEVPEELDSFVIASQICQAEAKKFFIESIRCRKPRMTGILWWNLMDCWPQFSDAIVDYYFNRKLAYYYIRRVQQPVCVMVSEPKGWDHHVIIVNDSLKKVGGRYRIWDAETGREFAGGSFDIEENGQLQAAAFPAVSGERALLLISWDLDSGEKGCNHYLRGTPFFELGNYRKWLSAIARLDSSFEPENVGQ